jgi:hypothetical protein
MHDRATYWHCFRGSGSGHPLDGLRIHCQRRCISLQKPSRSTTCTHQCHPAHDLAPSQHIAQSPGHPPSCVMLPSHSCRAPQPPQGPREAGTLHIDASSLQWPKLCTHARMPSSADPQLGPRSRQSTPPTRALPWPLHPNPGSPLRYDPTTPGGPGRGTPHCARSCHAFFTPGTGYAPPPPPPIARPSSSEPPQTLLPTPATSTPTPATSTPTPATSTPTPVIRRSLAHASHPYCPFLGFRFSPGF